MVMTKREAKQADEEWVVVGFKESKSVEKGWVVVAEGRCKKPDKAPPSEPERIDKVLANHGFCKRSEAKAWVRNGRVTFEGEAVKRIDQKVVVRLYDGVMVDGKPVPFNTNAADKENDCEAMMNDLILDL
eukprot:CAMPEP_0197577302 /NCGR_PEP_ID=MMETSP1326-20131121/1985_1 /TAXON_ID=1155430 /ORGANISM="Genus nov. species nov., Strain RCC2288" /LENGTH=129 /DNA_ID=CAMNT_0043140353 /DNA_START=302 /DNA_END=691 /DNA_ORIENTATION=+